MNFLSPHRDSPRGGNLPSAGGVRQAEVDERLEDGYPDVALSDLPVKRPREESIPELLGPILRVFGHASPVVTGILPPSSLPVPWPRSRPR